MVLLDRLTDRKPKNEQAKSRTQTKPTQLLLYQKSTTSKNIYTKYHVYKKHLYQNSYIYIIIYIRNHLYQMSSTSKSIYISKIIYIYRKNHIYHILSSLSLTSIFRNCNDQNAFTSFNHLAEFIDIKQQYKKKKHFFFLKIWHQSFCLNVLFFKTNSNYQIILPLCAVFSKVEHTQTFRKTWEIHGWSLE